MSKVYELKCPSCLEWIDEEDWKESTVDCESCDYHYVEICPLCDEIYDGSFGTGRESRFRVEDKK